MKSVVLIYAKYPEPGKVKTRLAKTMGAEAAALRYRELVEKNMKVLRKGEGELWTTWVLFDPASREKDFKSWLGEDLCYVPQDSGDLGERLSAGFKLAFEKGFRQVMALGSDTLNLRPAVIELAIDALTSLDVVIGPAEDGGYYLVGLNQPNTDLFEGIAWSTPQVMEQTLSKVKEHSMSYSLLQTLKDLDEEKKHEEFKTF